MRTADTAAVPRGPDPAPTPPKPRWWWNPWFLALTALVVVNLVYGLPRYLGTDPALSRIPLDPGFPAHYATLSVHVVAGNLTMVTALLQMVPHLQRRRPRLHRVSGRLYVAGALVSGALSLVLVPYSAAESGTLGTAISGALWVATTLAGLHAARRGRLAEHRRWMTYSFALALATSWGRLIFIAVALVPAIPTDPVVVGEISGWLGWILNLALAQWWLDRSRRRPRVPAGQRVGT